MGGGGGGGGGRKIAVGKQTAISIRVEIPDRKWVNVGMLLKEGNAFQPSSHDDVLTTPWDDD